MKAFSAWFFVVSGFLLFSTSSFADANLAIYKSGPASVVAGTDILYEIEVYNAGPDTATDVVVTDIFSLPPLGEGNGGAATCTDGIDNDTDDKFDAADPECEGLIFVGATAPCSLTGSTATEGTLECTLDPIPSGSSTAFTIKFHVSPAYLAVKGLSITNEASVSAAEVDPNTSNNVESVETIVEEVANLAIYKFVEPSPTILAGDIMFYTIWVDNLGPSAARNVVIRDSLLNSGDVSVQSCAFSVSQGGGSITQFTCTTGSLVQTQFGSDIGTFSTNILYPLTPAHQGRLRASFRMVANNDIDLTNMARVASDTPDPDDDNNEAVAVIDVIPVADLAAVESFAAENQVPNQAGLSIDTTEVLPPFPETPNYGLDGNNVTAGRRIEFGVSSMNTGPSKANNVLIEFLLPAGATVLADTLDANPGGLTAPGNCYTELAGEPRRTVICHYGALEIDDIASAKFQILIDPNVPHGTPLSIDFISSSEEFDNDLGNNVGSVQFTVNNWADLEVQKFAIGSPVAGKKFHYEMQIENHGPSTARNVLLRDFLPDEVTFLNAYINYGLQTVSDTCGVTAGSNTLFCDLRNLPPTGRVPVFVFANVLIDSDVATGTEIINTADVFLSDTQDPRLSDNTDSVVSTIGARADLKLVKTATADVYAPSQRMQFILTVTNNGPSTAEGVVITDTLPPANAATYVFDSGGCALSGTTLTCPVGSLANNESRSINVYMLPKGKKGAVTNTATVSSSTTDLVSGNNTSSKTVLIKGGRN